MATGKGYVLKLLFTSRQQAHVILLSRGFGIVSSMFKFLLCVLYKPAEEVFTSPGQFALSAVNGFSHFSGSVYPISPTLSDTFMTRCC